jgi:tetratricopeptide (TPR) repeat protein
MILGFRSLPVFILACGLGLAEAQQPTTNAPAAPAAAAGTNAAPSDPVIPLLKQAYQLVTKANAAAAAAAAAHEGPSGANTLESTKDLDDALNIINNAVKTNPKSFAALTLRGMIYSTKKDWSNAQADFIAALQLDPNNVVVKFNISETKFVQKQYDAARPGFVALESDPAMGDFASYKVFLCDLLGGHEDVASKELAAFNAAATHPSYYFSNAAWYLVHKKPEDARGWLISASNIYVPSKNTFYAASLKDLGYLPLPPPPPAQ